MRAMLLDKIAPVTQQSQILKLAELPEPQAGPDEVRIKVSVCGVCHTELDEIEGRTAPSQLPVIPGHQVVGTIDQVGTQVDQLTAGQRVGAGWIFSACGSCQWCTSGRENLCPEFVATGRDRHGGYAEYAVLPAAYVFPIPDVYSDAEAAPLLCAGAVGYRALKLCELENGQRLGLTGFGASAHLILQVANHLYPDSPVYVFARNVDQRAFALTLGADWAGNTNEPPPHGLDAIIDTTPAWLPVIYGMEFLNPGGRMIINAIRKESEEQRELMKLDYGRHLWMEKRLQSVANVTRADIIEFLAIAAKLDLRVEIHTFPMADANQALRQIRGQAPNGATVLQIE